MCPCRPAGFSRRGVGATARLVLLGLLAVVPCAQAQILVPAWDLGELGAMAQDRRRLGQSGDFGGADQNLRLWLKIPLRGTIGGERSLHYSLTLRPVTTFSPANGVNESVRLRQFDYDAAFHVSGLPSTSLAFALARSNANAKRSNVLFSETAFQARSADATVALAALPLRAGYELRDERFEWRASPLTPAILQSDRTESWHLTGENSRTLLRFDHTLHDDRVHDHDYSAWNLGADHTLRWGRGSRLHSTYRLGERDGSSPYREVTWEETLNLRHLKSLGSEWQLTHKSLESASSMTHTRSVRGTVHDRPARVLEWSLAASTLTTSSNGLGSRIQSVIPRVVVESGRTTGLRGRAALEGNLEHRSSHGTVSTLVPRLRELHTVDDTRAFLLDLSPVDTASVIVSDLATSTRYASGVDYLMVPVGDRLEIRLTVTSRIVRGQVLAVDYRFTLSALLDATVAAWRTQLSLDWRIWSLRHTMSDRRTEADEFPVLLTVRDEREWTTELAAGRQLLRGRFDGRARIESRRSDLFVQNAREMSLAWTAPLRRDVDVGLDVSGSRHDGTGGRVDVTSFGLRSNRVFTAWGNLGAEWRTYLLRRPGVANETVSELDVHADARLAALESRLQYRQQWLHPDGRGSMRLVNIQLVRHF